MDDLISGVERMSAKEAIEILKANYPDACFEQLRDAVDAAIHALKRPEYYDYSDIDDIWEYYAEEQDIKLTDSAKQLKDAMWVGYRKGKQDAQSERKNVVEIPETGIGDLSDGYHTFNGLYEQRMVLFAALVKAYKGKAWKSYRHEDGEYCFGGGWFIVGIDTPEGSYTYHYENKYWDMFDCVDLPRSKHWDGHTEADAETRLMSLEPERKKGRWIVCTESCEETFHTGSRCSACNYWKPMGIWNYCPNCGADMRGEQDE